MKRLLLLSVIWVNMYAQECPVTLYNDSPNYLLVTNPHQRERAAVRIAPRHSQTIDAQVKGWWKWITNQTLNIYVEREERETFDLRFQLIQKYCPDDVQDNKLAFSDIIKIANEPDKRLRVRVFETEEDDEDKD